MAKFLIFDNNIVATSSLLAKLRLAGHEADFASELLPTEHAMNIARSTLPDLIVIDPTVSGSQDGFSLICDLKSHPETREVLIVACSDSPSLELRERVLNLGASTHYDRSALPVEELIERLEKIIINKQKYEA